jgi:hypothetical protein
MVCLTVASPLAIFPVRPDSQLHEFVADPRAHRPFKLLRISEDFLRQDPSEWEDDESFEDLKVTMGIGQGVVIESLKYRYSSPCPTDLRPAGGDP